MGATLTFSSPLDSDHKPEAAHATGATTSDSPLGDPVAEARRVIAAAELQGITLRALGGVAIYLQSPGNRPLLPRALKDIDVVTTPSGGRHTGQVFVDMGYVPEEMFNALRGSRRQLYRDPVNGRDVDVFVGEFKMCHAIPVADRLDSHPHSVPLAELLLTKLQIVELNERDERDIYTLCYHHEVTQGTGGGIEADVIAGLCADDWGLWRTSTGTLERCAADLDSYELDGLAHELIERRLSELRNALEAAPKTKRWGRRARLGEHKRWYELPEEGQ